MTRVRGANGVVIVVSDELAASLIGDGSHGHSVAPNPEAPSPILRKRAPRKTTPK